MTSALSTQAFMQQATPAPVNSNSQWGAAYALELRGVVLGHAAQAPRTLQRHLGPSEIGVPCDRQVAGKLAGIPATNHVADPWASIVGTAIHAWMADAFMADNTRSGERWLVEFRVVPHAEHPGTGDLYDIRYQVVVDHKALSEGSARKIQTKGPPIQYEVQLLLYARGFRNLGLPTKRIVIAIWPRTKSSLDTQYVWERPITAADDQILADVFDRLALRKVYAAAIRAGQLKFLDVPAAPADDLCYFCEFYRPEPNRDDTTLGCPGPERLRPALSGRSA